MKPPRLYTRPGETFAQALARWRAKFQDYKDLKIMIDFMHARHYSARATTFFRAFYGVEMPYVLEVYYMLEATEISRGRWAIRPEGQLGTCGSYPYLWTVIYVNARSAEEAIKWVSSPENK